MHFLGFPYSEKNIYQAEVYTRHLFLPAQIITFINQIKKHIR